MIPPIAVPRLLLATTALLACLAAAPAMDPEVLTPVPTIQDARLDVRTAQGGGTVPVHVTRDWTVPLPSIQRAVIVIHGWPRRDLRAGEYAAAQAGNAAAGSIVITPQFLIAADIAAHHLPDATLRWRPNDWAIGRDATAPAPLSSFDVLDAILRRLADRATFPALQTVVIAGHSAGGRFVQHYAAVGHGQAPLLAEGIHIRYVVANPSAYLYFDATRPVPPAPSCRTVDRWEYGLASGLPRYAATAGSPAELRAAYLTKDLVYLLGTADNDPAHHQLDRSCAAEAQGPTRFQRGLLFTRTMAAAGATQTVLPVPGIGHHSSQMLGSPCGILALFAAGSCAATIP